MASLEQIKIRPFHPDDLDALHGLIQETIEISYAKAYPPRAVAFFKDFHGKEEILERGQAGTVLVVEQDGALVATGSLIDGEIFGVFVHPDVQGAGLGKTLMELLEEKARASGSEEFLLSVSLPSKKFYEGLGYEIVQDCSRDLGAGERLNFWKARKRLAPAET